MLAHRRVHERSMAAFDAQRTPPIATIQGVAWNVGNSTIIAGLLRGIFFPILSGSKSFCVSIAKTSVK